MNALSNWPGNRLLLGLPSRNLKRLMPELEHIHCQRAQILMDADGSLDHVFFPDSGVVSVVAVFANVISWSERASLFTFPKHTHNKKVYSPPSNR
jgi:hypothetical protein